MLQIMEPYLGNMEHMRNPIDSAFLKARILN